MQPSWLAIRNAWLEIISFEGIELMSVARLARQLALHFTHDAVVHRFDVRSWSRSLIEGIAAATGAVTHETVTTNAAEDGEWLLYQPESQALCCSPSAFVSLMIVSRVCSNGSRRTTGSIS